MAAVSAHPVARKASPPPSRPGAKSNSLRHAASAVFAVTTVAFFLTEMGDKTQIATMMLAARFESLAAVVAGTTLGMLIADVPVVFAGNLAADRIPFTAVRIVAALLFAALGVWVLVTGLPA